MAVIGLRKTISKELQPETRAIAVLPSAHGTRRIHTLVEQAVDCSDVANYDDRLTEWSGDVAGRGIGDPMELGEVIIFLNGLSSSYVTAVATPTDSGASAPRSDQREGIRCDPRRTNRLLRKEQRRHQNGFAFRIC